MPEQIMAFLDTNFRILGHEYDCFNVHTVLKASPAAQKNHLCF